MKITDGKVEIFFGDLEQDELLRLMKIKNFFEKNWDTIPIAVIPLSEMEKKISIKCIVKECSNQKHEGTFVGDICTPCFTIITTGVIGPTNSFIGELERENFRLKIDLDFAQEAVIKLQKELGEKE